MNLPMREKHASINIAIKEDREYAYLLETILIFHKLLYKTMIFHPLKFQKE